MSGLKHYDVWAEVNHRVYLLWKYQLWEQKKIEIKNLNL